MSNKIFKKKEILIISIVTVLVIAGIGVAIYLTDPLGWFNEDARNGNEDGCIPATVENGRFDVNGDGKVDLVDMVTLGDQYTISPHDNEYDITYDLNCDQIVDNTDMQLLADIIYS